MGTSHLTNPQLLWEKYMGKAKRAVCSVPYYLKKVYQRMIYAVKCMYLLHGLERAIFYKTWGAGVPNDNYGSYIYNKSSRS